jgi:hypothetical protein
MNTFLNNPLNKEKAKKEFRKKLEVNSNGKVTTQNLYIIIHFMLQGNIG